MVSGCGGVVPPPRNRTCAFRAGAMPCGMAAPGIKPPARFNPRICGESVASPISP